MSQQINLFNPDYSPKKVYFSALSMLQALGLIVIGAAVLSGYMQYQLVALNKDAATATRQLSLTQARLIRLRSESGVAAKNPLLDQGVVKAEQELQALQQVFDLLKKGEIGNTKGYSPYLQAFARQAPEGLWLTGFSIVGAGRELGLSGKALQPELVPAFITRLKREFIIQGKNFSTLEITRPPLTGTGLASSPVVFDLHSAGIGKDLAGGAPVVKPSVVALEVNIP